MISRLLAKTIAGNVRFKKRRGNMLGFLDVRSADAELLVDDGRVVKENMLFPFTRAALADELERLPVRFSASSCGIRNRRRRADELRRASVKLADAREPPEQVRQMASKDPAIGVQFIDDDESQIFKQLRPLACDAAGCPCAACPDC